MLRHAIGDLSQILYIEPRREALQRLIPADLQLVRALLAGVGLEVRAGAEAEQWLVEVRRLYEPYVDALAERLLFRLPAWLPSAAAGNWQTTTWEWEPAQPPPVRNGFVGTRLAGAADDRVWAAHLHRRALRHRAERGAAPAACAGAGLAATPGARSGQAAGGRGRPDACASPDATMQG
jgi:hypothetical protein